MEIGKPLRVITVVPTVLPVPAQEPVRRTRTAPAPAREPVRRTEPAKPTKEPTKVPERQS